MPHYTRINSAWRATVQPYNRLEAWRFNRDGYVNISGSWKYWFPNGYWTVIQANIPGDPLSGPAGSNSESGNSATVFGGVRISSGFPTVSSTYEYNGTSWSSGGNMISSRERHGGTGTAASPLAFCGLDNNDNYISSTEEYTASTNTWVSGGNYPFAGSEIGAAGTQTAALSVGGYNANTNSLTATSYEYNGTSWSTGGNMTVATRSRAGTGSQTAAVAANGIRSPSVLLLTVELYNGTSWSQSLSNNLRPRVAPSFCGTQGAALLYHGVPQGQNIYSEEFDGLFWAIGAQPLSDSLYGTCSGGRSNSLSIAGTSSFAPLSTLPERYTRLI